MCIQPSQKNAWLIFFFLCVFCRSRKAKIPASYLTFPTDSTVSIIQSFPDEVRESSGIIMVAGHLWTHNDSGDAPKLYQMNLENGQLTQEILIEEATAKDWEDIAQDSAFLYIGDFGNNSGRRQDLTIFKILKPDSKKTIPSNSLARRIEFEYPDRVDFNPDAYQHNFDCEAMITAGDSLYLFSKNHVDNRTRLYSLPKAAGRHIANLKATFDTKGTITGAGIDKKNEVVALVGYLFDRRRVGYAAFTWLFWDYEDHNFFNGKSKRINLPVFAQTEGICHWKNGLFLVGSEGAKNGHGKIWLLDTQKWVRE